MDAAAKVTSKGQVTVPKVVRDALGIKEGDQVVFRVEGNRAVLARTPGFLDHGRCPRRGSDIGRVLRARGRAYRAGSGSSPAARAASYERGGPWKRERV